MSFRARITLAAAAAVAVAVAVVSVAVYLSTSNALRGQVDDELRARAGEAVLRPTPAGFAIRLPAPPLGVSGTSAQIVTAQGDDQIVGPASAVPTVAGDRAVAAGDVAAARAAMRTHLGNSHDRFAAAWTEAGPTKEAA